MAGGTGTRFWPESRSSRPKQFLDMLGTGKSLLRMTFERFQALILPENIFVVTGKKYTKIVKNDIPEIPFENILSEPVPRNTAPCVAFAYSKIRSISANASIFVTPSDQFIAEDQKIRDLTLTALNSCEKENFIMTMGIRPTRPDTGYGYIQFNDEKDKKVKFRKVKTFIEKPNLEVAKAFLEAGEFLWNSGMFCFSAATIAEAFRIYLPDMHDLFQNLDFETKDESNPNSIDSVYARCKNVSLDYGILEKANNVYVLPAEITWSDLGTWGSSYDFAPNKDKSGNVLPKLAIVQNASGNLIRIANSEKIVVVDGLDGFVVVDSEDALLICRRNDDQKVRDFVAEVRRQFGEKFL